MDDIKQLKRQLAAEMKRAASLESELNNLRYMVVHDPELDRRVKRQQWNACVTSATSTLIHWAARAPSVVDVEEFDAKDWARLDEFEQALKDVGQILAALDRARTVSADKR